MLCFEWRPEFFIVQHDESRGRGDRGHSRCHRQHIARSAAQGRSTGVRGHPREARVGEPDRQHEGPDGAGGDRASRAGRPAQAGRHGGRVHGRQHRSLAGPGLRRQGLPPTNRQLRCVQPGEAGSDGGAGRGADAGPERGRPHDQEADPGHDRDRARAEPGAAHLLDRPAQQPRQHRGLLPAGRGDLGSDERRGRRVRPLRGHGARLRAGSPPC